MDRYIRVYLSFVRTCLSREMEFRGHFLLMSLASLVWTGISLGTITFVFATVRSVAGWDLDRMLLLTGTWTTVVGLTNLLFSRNMQRLSEMINKGELDLVLIKPLSSQFIVSTRFISLHDLPSTIAGVATVLLAIHRLALQPDLASVLGYLAMVISGIACTYSLWFMTVTMVVWTGRINNIAYLLEPIMDMGRVPVEVFQGWFRLLLTFVLPVAFIATLPSQSLLGLLRVEMATYALALSGLLLMASNRFWYYSLRRYSSASS